VNVLCREPKSTLLRPVFSCGHAFHTAHDYTYTQRCSAMRISLSLSLCFDFVFAAHARAPNPSYKPLIVG
jgi:hypothetical protein